MSRRWSTGPANISSPGDGVEFEVVRAELASKRISYDRIDALDRVDALAETAERPSPGNVRAVMIDLDGVEDWCGRRGHDVGDVDCLAGEGDRAEL